MELLKNFVPFLRNSNILIHYGSCLENLLELDEGMICYRNYLNMEALLTRNGFLGKEQFVEAKLMLKLYEFMDTEFLANLEDNTEDFFTTLDYLNEQSKSLKIFRI